MVTLYSIQSPPRFQYFQTIFYHKVFDDCRIYFKIHKSIIEVHNLNYSKNVNTNDIILQQIYYS